VAEEKVDPTGKRAVFEAAAATAPDRAASAAHKEGKHALFSMTPWRPGTVVVECSVCKVRRRASLIEVGARLALGSAWFPFRRHSHWMTCPTCHGRRWTRIGWTE
jgi:hypothetical protein